MERTKLEEIFTEGMLKIMNERKPMYDYQKAFFRMHMKRMLRQARQLSGLKPNETIKTLPDISHTLGRGNKSRYISYDELPPIPKVSRENFHFHHLPNGEVVSEPEVEIKVVKDIK